MSTIEQRYYTETGSNPSIQGVFHLAGPQMGDQILEEIRNLLERPGILKVAVVYNHGNGDRIEVFRKIKEQVNASTTS